MSKLFRLERVLAEGRVLPAAPLQPGELLALDPHRLLRVLRVELGDILTLAEPSGRLLDVKIIALEPLTGEVLIAKAEPGRNPTRSLEVWLPLLKGGKSEDLIRPLVELGVTRIQPFSSRHSVVRLEAKKAVERQKRMQAIADEACQQCGRSDRPEVLLPIDGLKQVPEGGVFLWEKGSSRDGDHEPELFSALLIGPEGGIHPDEAQWLQEKGWHPLWLGARILRAETAVITLTSLAQALRGEILGLSSGT